MKHPLKQINWGIIGCGAVTERKSGPAFNKVEASRLVAVMRRNGKLAADYAQRHHVPRWYDDADALIHDKQVNAVYIATPPSTHALYAIKAMKAGKPAYVEKPMAATYAQCLEMLEVSRETGIPLFVAYYRRSLPGFLKVKELIDEGAIGKPLMVNMMLVRPANTNETDRENPAWRIQPELAGGGIFYDLASHQLDYLDYLFGPAKQVYGIAGNFAGYYKAEDTVVASLRFGKGVLMSGSWSFVSDESSRRDVFEIIGTRGRIEFSSYGHEPVLMFRDKEFTEFPYLNPENIQYNLIKQIVEELQGKGHCVSRGESAARTNRVMEQITGGYYQTHVKD